MSYKSVQGEEINPFIPKHAEDPALYYKHQLRTDNRTVFLLLLAFFALQNIAASIVMLVQFFVAGGLNVMLSSISSGDPLTDAMHLLNSLPGGTGIPMIVGVIVGTPIFFLLRGKRLITTDITASNRPMTLFIFIALFLTAQAFQTVDILFSFITDTVFSGTDFSPSESYQSSASVALSDPTGLLYAMLIGPFCEELVFRGAILKTLEKYGGNYAIVVSSMIFGLYHVFLLQAIFAFLVGILLAYTARTYAFRWSVLLHVLINSSAILLDYAFSDFVSSLIFAGIFVLATVIVIKQRSTIIDAVTSGRPQAPLTWKYAFSAPAMLIFLAIAAAASIGMMFF
ncbi:MAG: CPBP family intramembrane metalloprotease [Clostridiales Family XIII bacterium]|jgi:membrane protease YdiL (CAAX protease family)|nr:CPBP family intramembrane metalloprotease [Clostridiales Family XIII bacterium]